MNRQRERELMRRAVSLGKSGQAEVVTELLTLVKGPSTQVRRLAVSALGNLAGVAELSAPISICRSSTSASSIGAWTPQTIKSVC